jgi:hypothetical protein
MLLHALFMTLYTLQIFYSCMFMLVLTIYRTQHRGVCRRMVITFLNLLVPN